MASYSIYGDNIVECTRLLNQIVLSLPGSSTVTLVPGQILSPIFRIQNKELGVLHISLFPGFGRWSNDILQTISRSGGILREAADAILTRHIGLNEEILLAVEYCGALPAGNQAWQRLGRAFSFAAAGIPYFYVSDLGGYELDANRKRKSPRMPNPATQFAMLKLSKDLNVPAVSVLIPAPGSNQSNFEAYKEIYSDQTFVTLLGEVIQQRDTTNLLEIIYSKLERFILQRADESQQRSTMSSSAWRLLLEPRHAQDVVTFLAKERISWKKTAYIKGLTQNFEKIAEYCSLNTYGFTSSSLPISILPAENIPAFCGLLSSMYDVNQLTDLETFLDGKQDIVICWIMGFKPKGDDARPDRGLAPFARMMAGFKAKILTIVYGPAKGSMWLDLFSDPERVASKNGLWQSILLCSDGVIVESETNKSKRVFLLTQAKYKNLEPKKVRVIAPSMIPKKIGEHDVDSVLHLWFTSLSNKKVFEGMCNPPGGDWSGISILRQGAEYRWLTLPRVSATKSKRPDHVFQTTIREIPWLLIIESKEKAKDLEHDIGPRLISYLADLFETPPDVARSAEKTNWGHNHQQIDISEYRFASVVAFLGTIENLEHSMSMDWKCDLGIAVEISKTGQTTLHFRSYTHVGSELKDFFNVDENVTIK